MNVTPGTTRYPTGSPADRALGDLLAASLHADNAWMALYEGDVTRARAIAQDLVTRALRALGALDAAEREGQR